MNNLISTSGSKLARTSGLPECFDILTEAGYTCTDFWLFKYSNLPDGPMTRDNWRDWVKDVLSLMDSRGLSAGQVHCLWNHPDQIQEDFSFVPPREIMYRSIEACRLLRCDKLVFHPLQRWVPMPDEATRRRILDINVAWFRALLPTAEKFHVSLLIENLFDYNHISRPEDPLFPFGAAEDIMYVINALDHPLMGVCLDTGHANINALDIPAMIRTFGSKLAALHLNDNYGKIGPIYEDLHLFPGYGRIEWAKIFQALKEVDYQGTLNMEPGAELYRMPHDIRVSQLRAAREILETMRKLYG